MGHGEWDLYLVIISGVIVPKLEVKKGKNTPSQYQNVEVSCRTDNIKQVHGENSLELTGAKAFFTLNHAKAPEYKKEPGNVCGMSPFNNQL